MAEESKRVDWASVPGRLWGLMRGSLRLVVVAVCGVVFLALLEDVLNGELMKLDRGAYWLVVEHMRADWLTPIMESFSALATPVTLLVLLVVLLNQLLKFIIQRPRPDGFRLASVSGFSFPSGHSMVAMAFFGLLAWLVWHYERDRRMRNMFVAAFALVIVMVGLSRVYLGVHYASAVLAGFCVSAMWLALYTRIAVPLFLEDEERPLG